MFLHSLKQFSIHFLFCAHIWTAVLMITLMGTEGNEGEVYLKS
jgi:hypothetical protein